MSGLASLTCSRRGRLSSSFPTAELVDYLSSPPRRRLARPLHGALAREAAKGRVTSGDAICIRTCCRHCRQFSDRRRETTRRSGACGSGGRDRDRVQSRGSGLVPGCPQPGLAVVDSRPMKNSPIAVYLWLMSLVLQQYSDRPTDEVDELLGDCLDDEVWSRAELWSRASQAPGDLN